jgi:hypothetical protein
MCGRDALGRAMVKTEVNERHYSRLPRRVACSTAGHQVQRLV